MDSDLGLYYLRARYYNPLTGKFVSQDPYPGNIFTPKSLHRYNYAAANPVNYIDPTGMDAVEVELEDSEAGASAPGERAVAKNINCILYTGASLLAAVSPEAGLALQFVEIDASECGAESEFEGETCSLCFAAGTPVHTNHGDVPIEKVEVGDEVEARNARTGTQEYEPVTALTARHKDKLLEIRIEGEHDPLRPSTHHPFWTRRGDESGRWIDSGELHIGDRLLTIDGNWRRITAITPVAEPETVYNFTVAKDHDYFVGKTGFLVHNANCPCNLRYTDRMSKNQYRKLLNDIRNNGILNKVINIVPIGGENYVLFGNNRLMAARQLGLTDQLDFQEVQLPFRGYQTEEDVINAASDFYGGGSCMY